MNGFSSSLPTFLLNGLSLSLRKSSLNGSVYRSIDVRSMDLCRHFVAQQIFIFATLLDQSLSSLCKSSFYGSSSSLRKSSRNGSSSLLLHSMNPRRRFANLHSTDLCCCFFAQRIFVVASQIFAQRIFVVASQIFAQWIFVAS